MKKHYIEEQIIKAIKAHEADKKIDDTCRDYGISCGTFYNWRSKYVGLEVNEAKRLRVLESENNKLKRLLADKLLELEANEGCIVKKVVTPAERKPIAQKHLLLHFKLSKRVVCKLARLSRPMSRYQPKLPTDDSVIARLKELATQYPTYGNLLLHGLLKREGLVINKKHPYRLYAL